MKERTQGLKALRLKLRILRVGVGVHQGLALSPYLFSLVIDKITNSIQDEIPWWHVVCG